MQLPVLWLGKERFCVHQVLIQTQETCFTEKWHSTVSLLKLAQEKQKIIYSIRKRNHNIRNRLRPKTMEVAQQILALDARYNSFRMTAFPQHSKTVDGCTVLLSLLSQEHFTYGDGTSC